MPRQMREQGAATVLYDLNFKNRVGTTAKPADPSLMEARAKSFYDYAVGVTGCADADRGRERALRRADADAVVGHQRAVPRQRARVPDGALEPRRAAAALGARTRRSPAATRPSGGGRSRAWRSSCARSTSPRRTRRGSPRSGPAAASRTMRSGLRGLVNKLTQIGIPSGRIALQLQFNSSPGLGARAGLQPASAWFEIVKLEALAAKQVAREFKIAGVWSWGWATFNANATPDPDKPTAACVWLWTRDPALCDAPAMAGPDFNTSLTDGQVDADADGALRLHRRRDRPPRREPPDRADRRLGLRDERPLRAGGAEGRAAGRPDGRRSRPSVPCAPRGSAATARRTTRRCGRRTSRSRTRARSSSPASSAT